MGNQAPVSGMDRENWHLGVFSMSLECGFFRGVRAIRILFKPRFEDSEVWLAAG